MLHVRVFTPDGNSLYFMSARPGGLGRTDIYVSHKQPDGQWGQAQPVAGGNINTEYADHCFMPFDLPGEPSAMVFVSIRPRAAGQPSTTDLYTTRQADGVWQPASATRAGCSTRSRSSAASTSSPATD
jgi:hypothetical protein